MKKNIRPENYADVMWELIMSDEPAVIARLEAKLDGTQSEAVDQYIENSCWSEDLPHLVGYRGTALERREALRAAYAATLVYDEKPVPDAWDAVGAIGEDIKTSQWRDDLLRSVQGDAPPYARGDALSAAFDRQAVYESDGSPAAARALLELADIVADGPFIDPEKASSWIARRADLALIGLAALEMLRLHRPREA